MIGQTLSHYRIIEQLGEGGMGVVYIAEDILLGRRVAIKTLTEVSGPGGQHFRSRFLREARAVSALSHPHIATIHDYGETDEGQPYIVMELVKGETLGDLMLRETLTIPRALQIIEEVAEALAEAHRHGIIHRDIKPSNVAINERGNVKVLDFGLAKQFDLGPANPGDPERQTLLNTQTREGVIVGTPMYLSPEQALGVEVDPRSDLFSLGGLLYECIAGKPPFFGRSPAEICAQVIRDDPAPPSQLNTDVPAELDRITLKALAKKPEERYQSADEMIADLRTAQANLETQGSAHTITRLISPAAGTHPSGALATLSDIFKRPRLSVGYVVAGLVVLGLISLAAWRVTRAKPHQPTPEVQRLYDRAVDAMREGAFFKASKILQQVVQEDRRFALAHARLAEAFTELDSSDKAKDELLLARELVPDPNVLPQVDSLRLQAVTDTVKPDFGKAVEDYRTLASIVPPLERVYALVDLGRAYEKNEQRDKAIETYQEATKLNPHYATAFLRLGVTYARAQKHEEARAAFDQAHSLFNLSSEIEGTAEVLLQRGIELNQQGKVDEAREQLKRALEQSTALENKDKQIRTLLNLSWNSITGGDTNQAQQYSTQALEMAQANGMENLTTAGLIDIGTAYFFRGNFPEADNYFNRALQLAQLYKGRRNEARALLSLASLRSQEDKPNAVPELVRRALAYYEPGGHRKETSTAYTILGRSYRQTGNYDAAQKAFEQQLQLAKQWNDPQQMAFAHEGLGSVFDRRQRYPDALAHYEENYRISTELKIRLSVGYGAMNRGVELSQLGKLKEASTALEEALVIAENAGNDPFKDLLAGVLVSNASLALIQRKLPVAITQSQRALDLSATAYKSTAVRAGAILGLARSMNGQAAVGRKHSQEAVDLARTLLDPRWLSDALLALSEAALISGDTQTALAAASEAQQRFANASQRESEWRASLILALANEKTGNQDRAQQLAKQAAAILAALENEWGSQNYDSYVSRPDVQECRKQLNRLRT